MVEVGGLYVIHDELAPFIAAVTDERSVVENL